MSKFIYTFGLLIFLVLVPSAASADDFGEVGVAVKKYFDGTEQGKPELLRETFLPSLEIQYVNKEGTLGRLTAADYISRFEPGKKANRKGRIVHMDVVGNAASVKAEIIMGDKLYTDYLLLLKLPEGWRVTNKIATNRLR